MALSTLNPGALVSSVLETVQEKKVGVCLYCNVKKSSFVLACIIAESTDAVNPMQKRADNHKTTEKGPHIMCTDCFDKGAHHSKTGRYGNDGPRCFFCVQQLGNKERLKEHVGFPMRRKVPVSDLNQCVEIFDEIKTAKETMDADSLAAERNEEGGSTNFRTTEAERRRQARSEQEAQLSDEELAANQAALEEERKKRAEAEALAEAQREATEAARAEAARVQEEAAANLARAEDAQRRAADAETRLAQQRETQANMPTVQVVEMPVAAAAAASPVAAAPVARGSGRGSGRGRGRGRGAAANAQPSPQLSPAEVQKRKNQSDKQRERTSKNQSEFKDLADAVGINSKSKFAKTYGPKLLPDITKKVVSMTKELEKERSNKRKIEEALEEAHNKFDEQKHSFKRFKRALKSAVLLLVESNPGLYTVEKLASLDFPIPDYMFGPSAGAADGPAGEAQPTGQDEAEAQSQVDGIDVEAATFA